MGELETTRRALLGGVGAVAALSATAAAQPAQPLVINVVDVAGNLALTQAAFEACRCFLKIITVSGRTLA